MKNHTTFIPKENIDDLGFNAEPLGIGDKSFGELNAFEIFGVRNFVSLVEGQELIKSWLIK